MRPIPGTDWHALAMEVSRDARIEYGFDHGDEAPSVDPHNVRRVRTFGVEHSVLEMEEYEPSPYVGAVVPEGERGTVRSISELGAREVHVYLPHRYPENAPYPVVYFNDGTDYVEDVETPEILDALIHRNAMRPVVAVFVAPLDRRAEYRGERSFLDFVASELVPEIDRRYRTVPRPEGRAIVGGSRGATGALHLSFDRAGVFGWCGMLAPAITPSGVLERVLAESTRGFEVYLLGGAYDVRFIGDYHNALDTLRVKGYRVRAREASIGHSPTSWKHYVPEMLSGFFPPARSYGADELR
jgi:enterochelin esterase family protein